MQDVESDSFNAFIANDTQRDSRPARSTKKYLQSESIPIPRLQSKPLIQVLHYHGNLESCRRILTRSSHKSNQIHPRSRQTWTCLGQRTSTGCPSEMTLICCRWLTWIWARSGILHGSQALRWWRTGRRHIAISAIRHKVCSEWRTLLQRPLSRQRQARDRLRDLVSRSR